MNGKHQDSASKEIVADYVAVVYSETVRPRTDYPRHLARYLMNRFNLRPGQAFLEIGCGRGEFMEAFGDLGLAATAVDQSSYAVDNLKKYNVKKCDVSKEILPFSNESFDIVYHKSLIEHLDDPAHLMRETLRVLKPGGQLIILAPDWITQMPIYFDDYTHKTPYTVISMKDMLNIFGFQNSHAELFYQLPVIWRYPWLRTISYFLQRIVPVTLKPKCKFIRWSIELMVLGYGTK